jgi:hypothetical protein
LATLRGIDDPKRLWTYPKEIGVNYINQVNSWKQVAKENKKDGSIYYDFIKTYRHDHFYDCEKMQIVAASMAGLIGMDVKKEESIDT